jgi:hypothetical protein
MAEKQSEKNKNYLKLLMNKAKGAINLMVGDSEAYAEEDSGGDLRFDPAIMLKTDVTFDKDFSPKEKVLKLNIRGTHFFNEIKRDIREINVIYIVYPPDYEFQIDVRREEWENKLMAELNTDYQLSLKKILFISEEEISRIYQRQGIKNIRSPYNLKKGELLIIAGGFVNFRQEGMPLARVEVNLSKSKNKDVVRIEYKGKYFGKYSEKSGAYFYVGGEWYHNLFIPELFNPEESRYFSFRIADDGKNLKFFSDLKKRGIDIRSDVKTMPEPKCEKIVHTINPAYLDEIDIKDFTLTIIYDIKEDISMPEAESPAEDEDEMEIMVEPRGKKEEPEIEEREENLPCLESEMTLLPGPKEEDISSYIMTIGDEKKNIKFYASSIDKEVSIVVPEKEEEVYKRDINDTIDYSIKLDSISYSISNSFLSRVDDKALKTYFAWELKSNAIERINLDADFYIFGREPLEEMDSQTKRELEIDKQLVRLNKSSDDFWRIGASRNHALLLKEGEGYTLHNISLNYPIYLIKAGDLDNSVIKPSRVAPVLGEQKEKLEVVLSGIGKEPAEDFSNLWETLKECTDSAPLENNDLVIIGSKVYNYIVPIVMESPLSDRAQKSILRTIQVNKSILRSY